MRNNRFKPSLAVSLLLGAVILAGCASVADEIGRMAAFAQCQFRLASVEKTTLAGVPLQGGTVSDISLVNLARLEAAFSSGTLPLKFTLELEVKNPNDRAAGMSRMEWILFVDDSRLTSGLLERAVEIGPRKTGPLPLEVALDMRKTLSGKTLDSMINLALNVAGQGANPSRVTLQVKPSMTVAGQALDYPGWVSVTHEFAGK